MAIRYEIFGEKLEEPEPKVVRLSLVQTGSTVIVTAVDECGERLRSGALVVFTKAGRIRRSINVNTDLGLALNKHRQICFEGGNYD